MCLFLHIKARKHILDIKFETEIYPCVQRSRDQGLYETIKGCEISIKDYSQKELFKTTIFSFCGLMQIICTYSVQCTVVR